MEKKNQNNNGGGNEGGEARRLVFEQIRGGKTEQKN